ncbi:hypothetical protein B0H13DRAFT_2404098 [Mycena leptocephala]|nr:hypothetical protein B0H13DRAFT_2404098 [Mycena leptocephala]
MRPALRPNRPLVLPAQCARSRPLRPHRVYPSINAAAIITATPPRRSLTRTTTFAALPLDLNALSTILLPTSMCRWNPNAFAHDILVSVARPAPFPFWDECGLLSESHNFGAFPSPLPCSLSTVHSPFHSPLPSYLCPLHSTLASTRGLISVTARACTVPYLKQQERVSPHQVPHRDAASLTPYHTHTPLAPTCTRAPRHLCPLPAHRVRVLRKATPPLETRARHGPPTYDPCPQVHAQRLHPRAHRSSPAIAARPVRSGHPATTPPSAGVFSTCGQRPPRPRRLLRLAQLRSFYLSHLDAHTIHAPGTTTPAGCSGRGIRFSLHTPPPSPPEAIHLRGQPMHARSKMPRSSATGRPAARETRRVAHPHVGEKEYGKGTA